MKMKLPVFDNQLKKVAYLESEVLKLERYIVLARLSSAWMHSDKLEDLRYQYALELTDTLRSLESVTREPPHGYRIIFLSAGIEACYWLNDKGQCGPTHCKRDSETYIMDCALSACDHNELSELE